MALLILGLALFVGTHLFGGFARGARSALIERIGAGGYKGLYSVLSLAGFVLIVRGWRVAEPVSVYTPPGWGYAAAFVLMTIATILFTAAYLPAGRIKSAVRHPMVVGTIVASLGHLLANGDSRSVIVFGAFLAYGVLDWIAVHKRGDYGPRGASLAGDGLSVAGGLIGAAVIVHLLHPYLAGVPLYPQNLFGG